MIHFNYTLEVNHHLKKWWFLLDDDKRWSWETNL